MSIENTTPCRALTWDTDFLGFSIARVEGNILTREKADLVDHWCHEHRIRCLYFLARSDDGHTTRLAEENGFRLVDVRLTFARETTDSIEAAGFSPDSAPQIRHARTQDIGILQTIARVSYRDTRFFYDPNFPRQLSEELYATWIKASCDGYADAVLVAEYNANPVGYISCHLEEPAHRGKIGLVGVDSRMRGRGIGRLLVLKALDWFSEQGIQQVTVVTQGRNIAAQRLYQRCGFVTRDVELWYHKWYELSGVNYG